MSRSFLACVGFMVDQRALNPLIRQTPYFAGVGGGGGGRIRTFGKICLFARLRGLCLLPSRGGKYCYEGSLPHSKGEYCHKGSLSPYRGEYWWEDMAAAIQGWILLRGLDSLHPEVDTAKRTDLPPTRGQILLSELFCDHAEVNIAAIRGSQLCQTCRSLPRPVPASSRTCPSTPVMVLSRFPTDFLFSVEQQHHRPNIQWIRPCGGIHTAKKLHPWQEDYPLQWIETVMTGPGPRPCQVSWLI